MPEPHHTIDTQPTVLKQHRTVVIFPCCPHYSDDVY